MRWFLFVLVLIGIQARAEATGDLSAVFKDGDVKDLDGIISRMNPSDEERFLVGMFSTRPKELLDGKTVAEVLAAGRLVEEKLSPEELQVLKVRVAEFEAKYRRQVGQGKWLEVCPAPYTSRELFAMNPYDVAGMCFKVFGARAIQFMGRHKALYSVNDSATLIALIDFGKASAPRVIGQCVLKGSGPFEYSTVAGADQTIPKLNFLSNGWPPYNRPNSAE